MATKVNEEKCVGCGSCESACPVAAIIVEDGKAKITATALNAERVSANALWKQSVYNVLMGGVYFA